MVNPDFVKLAQAMGVHAIRCQSIEDLPAKMKEFLEYDNSRPVVLECEVEKNEHVFPMVYYFFCSYFRHANAWPSAQVAAGKALDEQMLHPKLADATKKIE